MELTAKIVRDLITYSPDTGKLFWKERPNQKLFNKGYAGKETFTAITLRESGEIGRLDGRLFNKTYSAHRIAWLIYYGEWPKGQIDHINHDPTDNRIKNLRDVTASENNRNRTLQKNNKVNFNGVFFDKQTNRYRAQIKIDGVKKCLGRYDTVEEAIAARKVADINYNFHPNHGNSKGKEINA